MTDRYNQDLILGYIEGELEDAERQAFEATLADDPELRSLVAQMKLDRERLRSLGRSVAPVGLIDQVIQVQERAELLGDPEAPEPLTIPVNRHRFRRALMYSGIAAVLLLSAAVVVPTLMPSGLLTHPDPPLATNLTPTDTDSESGDLSDATFALADDQESLGDKAEVVVDAATEDSAEATVADARDATESESAKPETLTGSIPPVMADAESEKLGPAEAELALAKPGDTTAIKPDQPETDLLSNDDSTATTVAAAKQSDDAEATDAVLVDAAETKETDEAEAILIADATATNQPDETETAVVNPFGGYHSKDDTVKISENTQILVNTVSPTLASRQIRDWAISNSVRVEQEPADESLMNRAGAGGGAGGPVSESQLVIEIKQEQLPKLMAYLNSSPSQQAELVTLADADNTNKRMAAADDTGADKQPKALSNRRVDTRHWPGHTGITSAMTANNAPPAPRAIQSDADEEESGENASTEAQPQPTQPFDWSHLLDNITTQPLKPHTPLLQEQPDARLRLQVLIHQVAEDEVGTRDAGEDSN